MASSNAVPNVRSDTFARHAVLVFASAMLVNVFSYAFHLLISRTLGLIGYGTLSSLLATIMISSIPALIVMTIVAKYAALFASMNDAGRLRTLSTRLVRLVVAAGAIALVLAFAFRGPIASYLKIGDATVLAVLAPTIALNVMFPALRGVLQGVQDFTGFALATGLEAVGRVVFGVAFVLLGWGVAGAVAGFGCGTLLATAYTIVSLHLQFRAPPVRLRVDYRHLAVASTGIAISIVAITTLGSVDLLFVKHYFDARQAGLYGAVALTGRSVFMAIVFLQTLVLPKAAKHVNEGTDSLRMLKKAGLAALGIALFALAFYYFAPAFVLRVLTGTAFLAAAPYIFPYGIASAALASTSIVVNYKIGVHRFNFVGPLLAVMVAEIVAFNLFHATLWQIVTTIAIGHCSALALSLYGIHVVAPAHGRNAQFLKETHLGNA